MSERPPAVRSPVVAFLVAIAIGSAVFVGACKRAPEITCRVNDQCFVCPDEKAKTACKRDPTSSRCKWIEMSHCQP